MEHLPNLNSTAGFFFYSFLVYLAVSLLGWMAAPTLEKIEQEDSEAQKQHELAKKGEAMRAA